MALIETVSKKVFLQRSLLNKVFRPFLHAYVSKASQQMESKRMAAIAHSLHICHWWKLNRLYW
jgi:hypothetical protein